MSDVMISLPSFWSVTLEFAVTIELTVLRVMYVWKNLSHRLKGLKLPLVGKTFRDLNLHCFTDLEVYLHFHDSFQRNITHNNPTKHEIIVYWNFNIHYSIGMVQPICDEIAVK